MYQRVMRSPFNRSENRQVMKCSEPIRASSKTFVHKEAGARPRTPAPCGSTSVYWRFWRFTALMHVPWSGQPKAFHPPFLHRSFVAGVVGQPSTVKVACPVRKLSLAVLVNV